MTIADFKVWIGILRDMYPHAPVFENSQLMGWYGVFQDCDSAALYRAIPRLAKKCPRFPSIAEILEFVDPKADPDSEGRLIADRIWGAIERFGSMRGKQDAIKAAIGDVGWKVVENMGGWRVVCEIADYNNVASLKAQWRESAKAILEIAEVDERRSALGLAPSQERQALSESKPVFDALSLVNLKAVRPE